MIPKEIPSELKEYICSGVKLIMSLEVFDDKQKRDLLGSLLSLGAGAAWRPIGITYGAIKLFRDNEFRLPKGLERAHIVHRRETMKEFIETKWKEDWWDWFTERDYTILSTRAENRDERNFETVQKIGIPKEKNLFWGKRVGFEYGDPEKEFIINAARELGFI